MRLQVEEADAQVQELEAEQERLQRLNVDLSDRNSILEKYLQLKDSPEVSCCVHEPPDVVAPCLPSQGAHEWQL